MTMNELPAIRCGFGFPNMKQDMISFPSHKKKKGNLFLQDTQKAIHLKGILMKTELM